VGTMRRPIRHPALQRQWRCRRRWHREWVHEAGRGRRKYDVEMAEQRGVSTFVQEGRACAPLLDLAHLGEPLPPPAPLSGNQPCAGNDGGCGVEKGWLQISLFCSEDCRLRCVKFAQSIGIGNP
jgi:hypothetical protein